MTGKFIMESFWQHPEETNCATVAIIKAAILRYGIGKVFSVVNKDGYKIITLRNNKVLLVKDENLKEINKDNWIVFSRYSTKLKKENLEKLRDYVNLCFAVMVNYLKEYGYKAYEYYQSEATEELLEGFNTDHIHKLLGLKKKTKHVLDLKKKHLYLLKKKKAVILYSNVHVAAVWKGYYDDFGTLERIENKVPLIGEKRAKFWYELE